jgi:hypothetical protein
LEREVEVFEGFDDGESRTTQPLLQALVVAAVQFVVDELFEELKVTELVFESLLVMCLDGFSGACEA